MDNLSHIPFGVNRTPAATTYPDLAALRASARREPVVSDAALFDRGIPPIVWPEARKLAGLVRLRCPGVDPLDLLAQIGDEPMRMAMDGPTDARLANLDEAIMSFAAVVAALRVVRGEGVARG